LNLSWAHYMQSAVFAVTERPFISAAIRDDVFAKNVFPILLIFLEIDGARPVPFASLVTHGFEFL
jgi:hypothetical protein